MVENDRRSIPTMVLAEQLQEANRIERERYEADQAHERERFRADLRTRNRTLLVVATILLAALGWISYRQTLTDSRAGAAQSVQCATGTFLSQIIKTTIEHPSSSTSPAAITAARGELAQLDAGLRVCHAPPRAP